MATILVADDEPNICKAFEKLLNKEGHDPVIAYNGTDALKALEKNTVDGMFLDVRMPGMDGIAVLEQVRSTYPDLPVVIMTAHGTVNTAMDAMRLGAFDYMGKPLDLGKLRELIQRMLVQAPLTARVENEHPATKLPRAELLGNSPQMQEVFKLMGLLATNDLSVLIIGEHGIGKQLLARSIHENSARSDGPFTAVECGNIPSDQIETQLFGSSLNGGTPSLLDKAQGGTLYIAGIEQLPYRVQDRLLQAMDEGRFLPEGAEEHSPFDPRVIAATDQDLDNAVSRGDFREDLYHRLRLVTLTIPCLRSRHQDIELLVNHFIAAGAAEMGKQVSSADQEAMDRLKQHAWPGNVPELELVIKKAVLKTPHTSLSIHDLEFDTTTPSMPVSTGDSPDPEERLTAAARIAVRKLLDLPEGERPADGVYHHLTELTERAVIQEALELLDNNQLAASRALSVHRSTLRKKAGID